MPYPRGKTICFIDNANIYRGVGKAGWRIDWKKLQEFIEKGGPVWQTYLFGTDMTSPSGAEASPSSSDAFYHFVRSQLHWHVKLYEPRSYVTTCRNCQYTRSMLEEKGVDVGIATKMLILALNKGYDTAILMSGDGDLYECVHYILNLGIRVEIISWKDQLAREMFDIASNVTFFDDIRSEIELIREARPDTRPDYRNDRGADYANDRSLEIRPGRPNYQEYRPELNNGEEHASDDYDDLADSGYAEDDEPSPGNR
ncbi:MAG: NYN domain-containing protein [Desulfovibrio sp.]|nr:NYN domain-containing protein [Desulfovibrio sp.]MCA1986973.1 NYN domain-containing protein [Desulfovibrio sp.]